MNLGSQDVLTEVEQLEREYRWEEAAKLLQSIVKNITESGDLQKVSEIQQRIGICLERAAFQAESLEEFDRLFQSSIRSFRTASDLALGSQALDRVARAKYLEAHALFSEAQLLNEDSNIKEKLEDAISLANEALRYYDERGEHLRSGEICNFIVRSLSNRLDLLTSGEELRQAVLDVLNYGEKAVSIFSQSQNKKLLAEAYQNQYHPLSIGHSTLPTKGERDDCWSKVFRYADEAHTVAEELKDDYLLGRASFAQVSLEIEKGEIEEEQLAIGFQHAQACRDDLLWAELSVLAGHFYHLKVSSEENPDEAREIYMEGIEKLGQAIGYVNRIRGVDRDEAWASLNRELGVLYFEFASSVESDVGAKKRILEQAIKRISTGLQIAGRRAYKNIGFLAFLSRSKSLLATLETDASVKRRLLEEAIKLEEEDVELDKDRIPYGGAGRGGSYRVLAAAQVELAQIETITEKKIRSLQDALSSMDQCLTFTLGDELFTGDMRAQWLAESYGLYARISHALYDVTGDEELLRKSIQNLQKSAFFYQEAGLPSRMAEAHWKAGEALSRMRQHLDAAKTYAMASQGYTGSAEKVPQLADFYRDHSSYMRAWTEIERARHAHSLENFQEAAEHYRNVSEILKETKNWSHLSNHYLACSLLEGGEVSSKDENPEDANTHFLEAARYFENSSQQLESKIAAVRDSSEQGLLSEWISVNEVRRDYCLARALLEEGRVLDRKGERTLSTEKYSEAAKGFEGLIKRIPDDRAELESLALLSRALETMENAERLSSPDLFSRAAELFERAGSVSGRDRIRMITEANAYFCRALEAATIFKTAKNMEMYSKSKVLMENAAELYMRAGLEETSGWIKATHRMIDAYAYLLNAETEFDHKKKSELYGIAERLLHSAAQLFESSGFTKKKEETLLYLKRVKEQRELFTFPTEQSVAISTSLNLSTVPLTRDRPLGVEMFETANVQANVLTKDREVKVGETIRLEVELVNAGRGAALLVKMEDIVPEGFELLEEPAPYRKEDGYLNMKGKRLDPLKTEEVRLVLKPKVKGEFSIKPRILYLDEKGKYRYHECDPVAVLVKELGIKGWIKGPSS